MLKNKKNNQDKKVCFDMILNSPNIKYIKALDSNKIDNMKFGKNILEFSKILLTLKNIDFSYFYRNIETLKTQNVGGLIKEDTRAGYSVKYNFIIFKDYFNPYEMYHELIHLSTSIFDNINYVEFCGFSQYNYKTNLKIGIGINEGYTEYFNEKIFNNKTNTYIIEKSIAKSIEQILGSINMERLFFKANLKELIIKLSEYNSLDNTLEFIQLFDYISDNSIKFFNKEKLGKKFYKAIDKIFDYLILTYITKNKSDLSNDIISKDEYDNNLEIFINNLGAFNYYKDNIEYPMRFISEKKVIKKMKKIIKRWK